MQRRIARSWLLALATAAAGCSLAIHPSRGDLVPPDGSARGDVRMAGDAVGDGIQGDVAIGDAFDGLIVVDGPMSCGNCDDRIACTADACETATGQCTHTPDSTMCPNGRCDPTSGCVATLCSTDANCDDGTPCTLDRCAPTDPTAVAGCVHTPVDADGDGARAAMVSGTACPGGTDCDDTSPAVHPGAAEVCNLIDDDCDGLTDNGANCGSAPVNDSCGNAAALTIMGGSTAINGTTIGATNGPNSAACGGSGGDVWYAVTYPKDQVLRIGVAGLGGTMWNPDPVLVVRNSCRGTGQVCNDDYSSNSRNSRIWVRPDPTVLVGTRTVYVIVDAFQAGNESPFTLTLSVAADPGAGSCGGSMFDVSEGGSVLARTPTRTSSLAGSCGGNFAPEEVYLFGGPAGGTVDVAVGAPGFGYTPILYVVNGCPGGNELFCQNGNPARGTFMHTGAGSEYIVVDGGPLLPAAYALRVVAP